MAWNEPGKRDPWKGKDQADIGEMLRRAGERLRRLFGGGGPAHSGGFLVVALVLVALWIAFTSFTKIDAQETGVVLRFGKFNRLMSSGLNFKWPTPIEEVLRVNVTNQQYISDEVRMLTKDENIVLIDFNVQYTRPDARKYLFSAAQPDDTLKQIAEAAVRQVVGSSTMDTILSGQGGAIASETEKLLQQSADAYGLGLLVDKVNFQKIQPPPEVKDAFDDANNAGNNQQQFVNEAKAYLAKEVPLARGDAARVLADAEGYKAARIAEATGDSQRFSLVETQYRAAPEVTRKRLYLETMQDVLATTRKVIDQTGGKNLLYLPIDTTKAEEPAAAAALATEPQHSQPHANHGGGQ